MNPNRIQTALGALLALHDEQVFICGADDQPRVDAALHEARVALLPSITKTIDIYFRVVTVSQNLNNFGLRGYVVIAENGEAWEVARSDCAGKLQEKQDIPTPARVTVDADGRLIARHCLWPGFEIPRRLPDCPPNVLAEIYPEK